MLWGCCISNRARKRGLCLWEISWPRWIVYGCRWISNRFAWSFFIFLSALASARINFFWSSESLAKELSLYSCTTFQHNLASSAIFTNFWRCLTSYLPSTTVSLAWFSIEGTGKLSPISINFSSIVELNLNCSSQFFSCTYKWCFVKPQVQTTVFQNSWSVHPNHQDYSLALSPYYLAAHFVFLSW